MMNRKISNSLFSRVLVCFTIFSFLGTSIFPASILAQGIPSLPAPQANLLQLSPPYVPAHVTGMSIHPDNPFHFDFIVDTGDDHLQAEELREESNKLIKYFLAALTTPHHQMWVNLSPDEKDRITPREFGLTQMGRDLLAQDYLLKQLTASLMYPEGEVGEKFWQRVHQEIKQAGAGDQFKDGEDGYRALSPILNRIWIVPDQASVFVHENKVFVTESHLKVMLESDLTLRAQHAVPVQDHAVAEQDQRQSMIREIIIPAIEREVNEGKHFAVLRQIYQSLILAMWYKNNLKESLLTQSYADQNKIDGVDAGEGDSGLSSVQEIYEQYLNAFKQGAFELIKEEYDPATQDIIPRKYISGGVDLNISVNSAPITQAWLMNQMNRTQVIESVDLAMVQGGNNIDAATLDVVESAHADFQDEPILVGTELWKEFTKMNSGVEPKTVQLSGDERTVKRKIEREISQLNDDQLINLTLEIFTKDGIVRHISVLDKSGKLKSISGQIVQGEIKLNEVMYYLYLIEDQKLNNIHFVKVSLGDEFTQGQFQHRGLMRDVYARLEQALRKNFESWSITIVPMHRTTEAFIRRFGGWSPTVEEFNRIVSRGYDLAWNGFNFDGARIGVIRDRATLEVDSDETIEQSTLEFRNWIEDNLGYVLTHQELTAEEKLRNKIIALSLKPGFRQAAIHTLTRLEQNPSLLQTAGEIGLQQKIQWISEKFILPLETETEDQEILNQEMRKATDEISLLKEKGMTITADNVGDASRDEQDAQNYVDFYRQYIEHLSQEQSADEIYISIKFSALVHEYQHIEHYKNSHSTETQRQIAQDKVVQLKERMRELLALAKDKSDKPFFMRIDMEEFDFRDVTIQIFKEMAEEYPDLVVNDDQRSLKIGVVIQAYLRDTLEVLEDLNSWSEETGYQVPVRLVKGAYDKFEKDLAAKRGTLSPVFDQKVSTDANYEQAARFLFEHHDHFLLAFGTHNVRSIARVLALAQVYHVGDFEMQMLRGMGDEIKTVLVSLNNKMRVYLPMGTFRRGIGYAGRRLNELANPDNALAKTLRGEFDHTAERPEYAENDGPIRRKDGKIRPFDLENKLTIDRAGLSTTHKVEGKHGISKETLTSIAADYGLTVDDLIDLNYELVGEGKFSREDRLPVGMILTVRPSQTTPSRGLSKVSQYDIAETEVQKSGAGYETFEEVAVRVGMKVEDIMSLNDGLLTATYGRDQRLPAGTMVKYDGSKSYSGGSMAGVPAGLSPTTAAGGNANNRNQIVVNQTFTYDEFLNRIIQGDVPDKTEIFVSLVSGRQHNFIVEVLESRQSNKISGTVQPQGYFGHFERRKVAGVRVLLIPSVVTPYGLSPVGTGILRYSGDFDVFMNDVYTGSIRDSQIIEVKDASGKKWTLFFDLNESTRINQIVGTGKGQQFIFDRQNVQSVLYDKAQLSSREDPGTTHKVEGKHGISRETLETVAEQYKLSVAELIDLNYELVGEGKFSREDRLPPGMVLTVKPSQTTQSGYQSAESEYDIAETEVQISGAGYETFAEVAVRVGRPVYEIMVLNSWGPYGSFGLAQKYTRNERLPGGSKVKYYREKPKPKAQSSGAVPSSQNLAEISYDDLMNLINNDLILEFTEVLIDSLGGNDRVLIFVDQSKQAGEIKGVSMASGVHYTFQKKDVTRIQINPKDIQIQPNVSSSTASSTQINKLTLSPMAFILEMRYGRVTDGQEIQVELYNFGVADIAIDVPKSLQSGDIEGTVVNAQYLTKGGAFKYSFASIKDITFSPQGQVQNAVTGGVSNQRQSSTVTVNFRQFLMDMMAGNLINGQHIMIESRGHGLVELSLDMPLTRQTTNIEGIILKIQTQALLNRQHTFFPSDVVSVSYIPHNQSVSVSQGTGSGVQQNATSSSSPSNIFAAGQVFTFDEFIAEVIHGNVPDLTEISVRFYANPPITLELNLNKTIGQRAIVGSIPGGNTNATYTGTQVSRVHILSIPGKSHSAKTSAVKSKFKKMNRSFDEFMADVHAGNITDGQQIEVIQKTSGLPLVMTFNLRETNNTGSIVGKLHSMYYYFRKGDVDNVSYDAAQISNTEGDMTTTFIDESTDHAVLMASSKTKITLPGGAELLTSLDERDLQRVLENQEIIRVESNREGRVSTTVLEKWVINNTSGEYLDRTFEIVQKLVLADQERENPQVPITMVDWGFGTGVGLPRILEIIREWEIPNVRLIAFADQYYPEWENLPEGVTVILDSAENFPQYFLPGTIDLIYSNFGIHHFVKNHPDYFTKIENLLSASGEVRFSPIASVIEMKQLESLKLNGLNFGVVGGKYGNEKYIRITKKTPVEAMREILNSGDGNLLKGQFLRPELFRVTISNINQLLPQPWPMKTEEVMNLQNGTFFATVGGRAVGYVTVDTSGFVPNISHIAVDPVYRGQQFGLYLTLYAMKHLREQGGRRVKLQFRHGGDGEKRLQRIFKWIPHEVEQTRPNWSEAIFDLSIFDQIKNSDVFDEVDSSQLQKNTQQAENVTTAYGYFSKEMRHGIKQVIVLDDLRKYLSHPLLRLTPIAKIIERNFPNARIQIQSQLLQGVRYDSDRVEFIEDVSDVFDEIEDPQSTVLFDINSNLMSSPISGMHTVHLSTEPELLTVWPSNGEAVGMEQFTYTGTRNQRLKLIFQDLGFDINERDFVLTSGDMSQDVLNKQNELIQAHPELAGGAPIIFVNMYYGVGELRENAGLDFWKNFLTRAFKEYPTAKFVINEGSASFAESTFYYQSSTARDQIHGIYQFFDQKGFGDRFVRVEGGQDGENDILRLMALLSLPNSVIVTIQSGVLHLADWMHVPTVSISDGSWEEFDVERDNRIRVGINERDVISRSLSAIFDQIKNDTDSAEVSTNGKKDDTAGDNLIVPTGMVNTVLKEALSYLLDEVQMKSFLATRLFTDSTKDIVIAFPQEIKDAQKVLLLYAYNAVQQTESTLKNIEFSTKYMEDEGQVQVVLTFTAQGLTQDENLDQFMKAELSSVNENVSEDMFRARQSIEQSGGKINFVQAEGGAAFIITLDALPKSEADQATLFEIQKIVSSRRQMIIKILDAQTRKIDAGEVLLILNSIPGFEHYGLKDVRNDMFLYRRIKFHRKRINKHQARGDKRTLVFINEDGKKIKGIRPVPFQHSSLDTTGINLHNDADFAQINFADSVDFAELSLLEQFLAKYPLVDLEELRKYKISESIETRAVQGLNAAAAQGLDQHAQGIELAFHGHLYFPQLDIINAVIHRYGDDLKVEDIDYDEVFKDLVGTGESSTFLFHNHISRQVPNGEDILGQQAIVMDDDLQQQINDSNPYEDMDQKIEKLGYSDRVMAGTIFAFENPIGKYTLNDGRVVELIFLPKSAKSINSIVDSLISFIQEQTRKADDFQTQLKIVWKDSLIESAVLKWKKNNVPNQAVLPVEFNRAIRAFMFVNGNSHESGEMSISINPKKLRKSGALQYFLRILIGAKLKEDAVSSDESDRAAISDSVGGIDMNPEMINFTSEGEAIKFNLPLDNTAMPLPNFNGLTPVIINIQPVTNFPMLLGINPDTVPSPYAQGDSTLELSKYIKD